MDNSAAVLDRPDLSLFARQQAVERVRRASWRMRSLITSLLDYTQARSGHGLTVTRASCDLRKTCEDVIDATRAACPRQRFVADLAGDLTMAVDGNRVEQMLGNLLANAAQHGAPGGLVSLTARGGADEVVLSVRNTGQPIPQELLPTIFDPLVQGPRAAADHSIGLGLFIVREIVRGHQGRIDVASTQAGGTVFTVRLPRPAP
ncbi:MAG: sensor histidine kinase [Roseateles sp.]|uniref:sensor histidine kinase n=1 Tax=Roseateles sp. TaxID=1971397 RepID=UPI00403619AF